MNDDLDKKLTQKYPKIFKHRGSVNDTETLMGYGFAHGDGWYDILDALCASIQQHISWKRKRPEYADLTDEEFEEAHQTVAVQVKEKFGGLRFYVSGTDDYIRGAIDVAESMSLRTCEDCGAPGRPRSGGWIRTLCDSCTAPNKRDKDA
jgi:hypothetical protein